MNDILYIEDICNKNKNLDYVNIKNLTYEGYLLLLLYDKLDITGKERIRLIKNFFSKNHYYKFSDFWEKSPLLFIAICGLNKNLLNNDEIYELIEIFIINGCHVNLCIDHKLLGNEYNNPINIGQPLDIILLNSLIKIENKKKIMKLFYDNNYNYNGQIYNYIDCSLFTKILCYNDMCYCNYDIKCDTLCDICIKGGTFNKLERYELANFLVDECGFNVNIYKGERVIDLGIIAIKEINIINEILLFANSHRLLDAIIYLTYKYKYTDIFTVIISYDDIKRYRSHINTENNIYINIGELNATYLYMYDYLNNTYPQHKFVYGDSSNLNFIDILTLRNEIMIGIYNYNMLIKPLYLTKYIREIHSLLCIKKYGNLKSGINEIIKYILIKELFQSK